MKTNTEIVKKLKELTALPLIVTSAVVLSVDSDALSMLVQPKDEAELLVRLKSAIDDSSEYMVQIPRVGSSVLVALIENDESEAVLLKANELDQLMVKIGDILFEITGSGVSFNGGNNGGLINIEQLVNKLNTLEERMITHQHICAAPGSVTAPDPASNTLIAQTQVSELEDNKVTH